MNASEIEHLRRMAMRDLRAMQEKPAVTPGTWIWRYDDSKYKYWSLTRGSLVTTIDEASKYDSLESAIDSYRFDHRLAPGVSFARVERDASGQWREAEIRRLEETWAVTCSQCGEFRSDSVQRESGRVCAKCIDAELSAALRRAEEAEARCIRHATNEHRAEIAARAQVPKYVQGRSADEITRLRHTIDRMRGAMDSLEAAVANGGPIGGEVAEGIQAITTNMMMQIVRHDAYLLKEKAVEKIED